MYEERRYRHDFLKRDTSLIGFRVFYLESDLFILAETMLEKQAYDSLSGHYLTIKRYIQRDPEFRHTFSPYLITESAPEIIRQMSNASGLAGVGPMAAVAGAVAEAVGKELLAYSQDIIVENGGDIFLDTSIPRKIGILAGSSVLSEKIALLIEPGRWGVCTSSGTVGHSISLGKADACVVVSESASLSDAAATRIGNIIQTHADIPEGLSLAQEIVGVLGVVIIKDDKIGVWGKIELVGL
ncbi:UPF0280 family protein [bacterium]|nr:UPF0280 family protein [bacterium]